MNGELLEKVKSAKSAKEFAALAREAGLNLPDEKIKQLYADKYNIGELSDDELDAVAGGGCAESKDTRVTFVEPVTTDDGVSHLGHSGSVKFHSKHGVLIYCDCGSRITVHSERVLRFI